MNLMQRVILIAAAAAAYLVGFWPSYPPSLQAMIAAIALLWAWAGKRGGGLLAPYTAHMTLDWLVDPIL